MSSIDDVARLAGVSTATVSRALSGRGPVAADTRDRVEAAAARLGYVVSSSASSLASGRTRNIGVMVPLLDMWFFSTVLSGITATLMQSGYDITLYNLTIDRDERERIFDTFLRRQRVDGVILIAITLDERESARLRELDLPVVAIGGPSAAATVAATTLTVDDVAVGRLATEHLLEQGHRVIAHIGADGSGDRHHVPTLRRRGFEEALADASIPVRPELVVSTDFTLQGGADATRLLLDGGGTGVAPTAIFAASDELAVGALTAARERGVRVPEDLSVVGVDGSELGAFFRLTTVDQFPLGQGERAATTMLAELEVSDDRTPQPGETLPFELVVRGSTAPPAR
ncbi:LacI family DNA-binding transcriptional regulator [Microbacterium sp. P03]|uniref:LacI family DNA-binding transcriptional regulator n=1 Tax=Microbacterium sp. P03 TaxID=3366946 RepID=UPI003745EE9B